MPTKVFTPGEILTAADTNAFLANKSISNAIINGAFDIWQRGTTFTSIAAGAFSADRFRSVFDGTGVRTVSRETFTPGQAPVAGYESSFFLRVNQTTAGTGATFNNLSTPIESVRTFANQVVTLSFFAKANAATTITTRLTQFFGTAGSPSAQTLTTSGNISVTTGWQRFTFTATVPSLAGKTISSDGTDSLRVDFRLPLNNTFAIDIWGVQLEPGTVANDFRRNANSIQGELAACQRYLYRINASEGDNFTLMCNAGARSATQIFGTVFFPVKMRIKPSVTFSTVAYQDFAGNTNSVSGLSMSGFYDNPQAAIVFATVSGAVVPSSGYLMANNNAAAFIQFNAEL